MSFIKTVENDAEAVIKVVVNDIEWVGTELEAFIKILVKDEWQEAVKDFTGVIKNAIVTLQNESPGIDASNLIPSVVAAVVPQLPAVIKDLQQTAVFAVTSYVAGQMGVPNVPGNAGVVTTGSPTVVPSTDAGTAS